MGDRGNIVVRQESGDVWFYTHWRGSEIGTIAKLALARKERWGDDPYLARIIFDELTKGDHGGESGIGISTSICDNQYPILVIDVPKQTVWTIPEDALEKGRLPKESKTGESFTDYVA